MTRAAALLAFWLAAPMLCAAQEGGGAGQLQLLDVPYVSQDVRLCGGAAAAMLARAAGARGVYSTDFASLVDERAGGIRTSDLESALRGRGYGIRAWHGTSVLARERLAAGQPVLALIEDRPGRYHYVVIVGWADGAVVYHDPARAPFVARREADFDRAWTTTQRWMLVLDSAPRGAPASGAPVSDGTPAPPSPAAGPFVDGHYREAARLAADAVERDPRDTESWQVLGASRYLLGDPRGALDAWNRAGLPKVDLVRLDGLTRTPHRRVERLIGIEPGTTLTWTDLTRAERRVALLPSRQASRVSYVALPGNLAEIRGTVLEREQYPSRVHLAIEAARLPIDRELGVSFSNLASAGDRLRVGWRFWRGRPRLGFDFAFASGALPGIWSLSAAWLKESYAAAPYEERREARLGWTNWITARARLGAGASLVRARGGGTQPVFDGVAEFRPLSDGPALEVAALGGAGSDSFATLSSSVRWRSDEARPARLLASATVATASRGTRRDRWPGADTRGARPLLLRAHPLLDDGRIAGEVFGRTVAHGTIEAQRDVLRKGLFSAAIAGFADLARASSRPGGASPLHLDVGAGVRLRLTPGVPTLRIDVARGLRDGTVALSLGFVAR